MPPQKRTKTGNGKGGRKADSTGVKPAARKKTPPTPVLIIWIFAILLLTSLIYFSRSHGPQNPPRPPLEKGGELSSPMPKGGETRAPEKGGETRAPSEPSVQPSPHKDEAPFSVASNRPAPGPPQPPPVDLKPKRVAKISIVIDDFGTDIQTAEKFIALPFPVTISVLPHQAHSREIAELAHAKGKEVILHLPMEPLGYPKVDPGKGALLLAMSRDELVRKTRAALDDSPYFDGVNNHEGSRMTQNAEAMRTILTEVRDRGFFFLDSLTTADSKALKVAREMKMPSGKRDIFLDNSTSADSIRAQISRLVKIARVQGTALAIGHPHEATFQALRRAAEELGKEGVEVVPVRDLMSNR